MVASEETCEGAGVNTALFIRQTYPQLAVGTARGNGNHLSAVAVIRGCEKAVHADFIRQVRAGMASSVAQPEFAALSEAEKAEQYFYIVDGLARAEFSDRCGAA